MIQDFQVLQQQGKMINQFGLSQQIIAYQSLNCKVEELQQVQKRLKNLIDETNKSIELIDIKFIDENHRQIIELANNLDDYQDKFQYLSKNQKYQNKIDQLLFEIKNDFQQVNCLIQLFNKGVFQNYQQFNQIIDSINQDLYEFQKKQNQLQEQIYEDQQIEQQHVERKKQLTNTEGQLNEFIVKMNKFQTQINNLINNEYCNNEFTKIMNKQKKIDQNMNQIQEQFKNFTEFNQLTSQEIKIKCYIWNSFKRNLKNNLKINRNKLINFNKQFKTQELKTKAEQKKNFYNQLINYKKNLCNFQRNFKKLILIKIKFKIQKKLRKKRKFVQSIGLGSRNLKIIFINQQIQLEVIQSNNKAFSIQKRKI
ncbi:unnamed protein product [Paramecium sonneborni]|uniref:Uncharacterized protein n=1 Tax=Paramecium sonneborni TaxID=65129 RepID=A0A8S1QBL2_9CILI|nr:unnamed protein product [Paramecium sonneborni]